MAITAVVVSATLATTGDTAFTSSGFGTPDAAIILIGRGNTTNNPEAHALFVGGFWCSDPGQVGICFGSEDSAANSDARRFGSSSYAGPIMRATTDVVAVTYSASSTTDGINLTVATGSTAVNRYASVILLKGLTNAHVGAINLGTGTSAINVTAPGFRADLVLLLSAWAADATATPSARGSFGAAQISAGGTVAQGCISYESTDNAAASNARTIVLNDKALARISSGALAVECAIGANASGFDITPSADSSSQYAYYLAIECPDPEDAYVGVVDTITGTGDQAYTGAGLTPQALILASTLATAVDTVTDSGAFNVGFGGPTTSEWSSCYIDEYASDPTDTEGYVDASNILHIRSAVGTEDTVAALTTFGTDGWTLNYSNGSGTARKVLAIAIGNAPATGTIARPTSDITDGAWLPSTGSDLYAVVDETTANDTDYIYTSSASTCEMALSAVTDPASSSGQVVRYRAKSDYGNDLVATLKQGGTTIATRTHTSVPATWTDYTMTLTSGECDAITDYGALRVSLEAQA